MMVEHSDRGPSNLPAPGSAHLEYLVFELAMDRVALPLADVREVLRAVAITRLPGAPATVEGVIDVRGSVIPVIDVRTRVGLPRKRLELEDHLIVVQAAGRTVALRVDRVHWTVRIDPRTIESTREVAPDSFFLAGVAGMVDGLVLIHDLQRFLSPAESRDLARALDVHVRERIGG